MAGESLPSSLGFSATLSPSLLSVLVSSGSVLLAAHAQASEHLPKVDVPFACGRAYPVSQGHQMGSHLQNDAFAWDFRMPEGTPVVAAADGVVRRARGDSTRGGCDMRFARDANYVVVAHRGGIETQYLHFVRVVVKPGDRVKKGDLLGYSGATGWACGAHLHFKVARSLGPGWNNPSVPALLADYGDPTLGDVIAAPACTAERPYLASLEAPASPSPAPLPAAAPLGVRVGATFAR